MRTYLVAYDLARPEMNQPYLAEALMGLGEQWARPLDNVWYLRTASSEADIEARLARLLDDSDGLLVQEARGDAVLANTGLRWFRRRRSVSSATVIAFAGPDRAANDDAVPSAERRLASA